LGDQAGLIDVNTQLWQKQQKVLEDQKTLETEITGVRLQAKSDFDSLLASLDPLVAAQQEFAAGQVIVAQAVGLAGLSAEKEAEVLAKLKERFDENSRAIKLNQESFEGLVLRMGDAAFQSFNSWIDSAVDGTFKLRDALSGLLKDLAKLAFQSALLNGLKASGLGGIFNLTGAAMGRSFPSGTTLDQGIYTQPTFFKFAKGGVLGEAGPEAVLPLARMPSGDLGVQSGPANVVVNITESKENQGTVSQRKGPGGKTIIDVIVDQVRGEMSSDIMRGRGLSSALEQQYGLSRAPGAY
jgi:hypothetical protein